MRSTVRSAALVMFATLSACGGEDTGPLQPPTPQYRLTFIAPPEDATAGKDLNTVTVGLTDAAGALVVDVTGNVTLQAEAGSFSIEGTTTATLVAGVASFPGLKVKKAGSGYRLSATSPAAATATSSDFEVVADQPVSFTFGRLPVEIPVGSPLEVTIQAIDEYGNAAISSDSISLVAFNEGSGRAFGSRKLELNEGRVTTVLSLTRERGAYTLKVQSSWAIVASDAFDVFLPVAELVGGNRHYCAVAEAHLGVDRGAVYCWGDNRSKQVRRSAIFSVQDEYAEPIPQNPAGINVGTVNDANSLAAGAQSSCALIEAGQLLCWGDNRQGQLDGTAGVDGDQFFAATGYDQVSMSYYHSCFVKNSELQCWGRNFGQVEPNGGTGIIKSITLEGVVGVATGEVRTCAIVEDTTAGRRTLCWGDDGSGALGDGPGVSPNTRVEVVGGEDFVRLWSGSGDHTCALDSSDRALCWGYNGNGQLGNGSTTAADVPTPVQAPSGVSFTQLTLGSTHTCGLDQAGAAYCWGSNFYGQLGIGTDAERFPEPAAVVGGLRFKKLAASFASTCGVTESGRTYCWGQGSRGQLGIGDQKNENHSSPVPVR